ncbi:hypothetical protein H2200_009434 [Cladophialophora chaetospira]|uniref:Uncharacterized protein n=1 Tax=Cladophialophora chaetospira TaxID=386627 RepID=A0AA39CFC9_9EURO|nr:hypothetical protein H2200_009434 [Cladophialophora chaetospira]
MPKGGAYISRGRTSEARDRNDSRRVQPKRGAARSTATAGQGGNGDSLKPTNRNRAQRSAKRQKTPSTTQAVPTQHTAVEPTSLSNEDEVIWYDPEDVRSPGSRSPSPSPRNSFKLGDKPVPADFHPSEHIYMAAMLLVSELQEQEKKKGRKEKHDDGDRQIWCGCNKPDDGGTMIHVMTLIIRSSGGIYLALRV